MSIRKVLFSCIFAITILSSTLTENTSFSEDDYLCLISDRVQNIVTKIKIVNGIKYARRWDATNNKWYDSEWKRVD